VLLLVLRLESLSKPGKLVAVIATLIVTMPIPLLLYVMSSFWLRLSAVFPDAPIGPLGVSRLGIYLSWLGLAGVYVMLYATFRSALSPCRSPAMCAVCGYDSSGLERCPECGTPVGTIPLKIRLRPLRRYLAGTAAMIALLAAPLWLEHHAYSCSVSTCSKIVAAFSRRDGSKGVARREYEFVGRVGLRAAQPRFDLAP